MNHEAQFADILREAMNDNLSETHSFTNQSEASVLNLNSILDHLSTPPKASKIKGYGGLPQYKNWINQFPIQQKTKQESKKTEQESVEETESPSTHSSQTTSSETDHCFEFKDLNMETGLAWIYLERQTENWPKKLTLETLKKQYRYLALRLHPDQNNGNYEEFLGVQEAYKKLISLFE